jgi:hypothetical protein
MRDAEVGVRISAVRVATEADPPVPSVIVAGLGDKELAVRRLALLGVIRHKVAAALPQLPRFIVDSKSPEFEDGVYAMDAATAGGRADLIFDKLFADADHPGWRPRAALVLAERGDRRVHDYMVDCLLAKRCTVKQATPLLSVEKDPSVVGKLQLAWVRARPELSPLMVSLQPPGTTQLALAELEMRPGVDNAGIASSIKLLEELHATGAPKLIAERLPESNVWQRLRLDAALDRFGVTGARQRVLGTFDKLPIEWLPRAVDVLGELENAAQKKVLSGDMSSRERSDDYHVALAAAALRLKWENDAALERLLVALASTRPRERELSRRYLREFPTELLTKARDRERRPIVREELERLLTG